LRGRGAPLTSLARARAFADCGIEGGETGPSGG
jgi:hypothetical protein